MEQTIVNTIILLAFLVVVVLIVTKSISNIEKVIMNAFDEIIKKIEGKHIN